MLAWATKCSLVRTLELCPRVSVSAIPGCWVSAVTQCPPCLTRQLRPVLSDALWWLQHHRKDLEAHISQHISRPRKTMTIHFGLFHREKSSRGGMEVHTCNSSTWKQGRRTVSSRLLRATELPQKKKKNQIEFCYT